MLREAYNVKQPLGDAVIRKLLRDFRLYMLVGVCHRNCRHDIAPNLIHTLVFFENNIFLSSYKKNVVILQRVKSDI